MKRPAPPILESDLPATARDLVRLVGWAKAEALIRELGGIPYPVPKAADNNAAGAARFERLAEIVGQRGAERFFRLREETPRADAAAARWADALTFSAFLATAIARLRAKIKYRPVIFELAPEAFTLSQLQRLVESIAGLELHKQNFRRLLDRTGLVESLGRFEAKTGGRPAELFRFRREVLRERPVGGVNVPAPRS